MVLTYLKIKVFDLQEFIWSKSMELDWNNEKMNSFIQWNERKKKSSSPTLKYSLKSRDYEVLLRLSSSIQRMKMFDCNDERVVTLLNNEQATGRQKKTIREYREKRFAHQHTHDKDGHHFQITHLNYLIVFKLI